MPLLVGEHYGPKPNPAVSEVIREALSLLEEREARLEALRAALIEGEKSGVAGPIDRDTFLQDMHAEWKG